MKVFITGATGFLGSVIARQLLSEGIEVCAIRRQHSSMDLVADIQDQVQWFEGDVLDPDSLEQSMAGVDGVFHCAAFLGFEGKNSEAQLMSVNVTGTANVIDAALACSIPRLLHVSSIAALGRAENQDDTLNEETVWKRSAMNTSYAISKHEGELEVYRGIALGLDAVIVNPSLVMGPGRLGENTMQIAEKLLNHSIPVLPPGATNVVDVEDVAAGAIQAFHKGRTAERYVLSGHNLLWRDIIGTLAAALQVKPPSLRVSRRVMIFVATVMEFAAKLVGSHALLTRETARLSMSISRYDNSKAIGELGCEFRPFDETAARIAASFHSS